MKKTIFAIAAALALASSGAGAKTAISRALDACGKLDGAPYHTCLDRIPKCKAVIENPSLIPPDSRSYWHKGMVFEIVGGSDDLGQLCMHGGGCIPIAAVKFKTACMLVKQDTTLGTYYRWELGNGSLPKDAKPAVEHSETAETAAERAFTACQRKPADRLACESRIPKCTVVIENPSLITDPETREYWHKGMDFDISGSSDGDPGMLCQHAGDCIPMSAVKFKTPCLLVIDEDPEFGTSYSWEYGDGSISKKPTR